MLPGRGHSTRIEFQGCNAATVHYTLALSSCCECVLANKQCLVGFLMATHQTEGCELPRRPEVLKSGLSTKIQNAKASQESDRRPGQQPMMGHIDLVVQGERLERQ